MSYEPRQTGNFFRNQESLPVLILIAINVVIMLFVLPHYGESWDENHQYNHYADHVLKSYGTWLREGRSESMMETTGVVKDSHGPAFVMTVEFLTRLVSRISPEWNKTDVRHFFHFLTFQIGLLSLYFICRRWLNTSASFGATLLFMTQPVFWGHGVINPKDMPFAALFLLSVWLGLRMYDYMFPTVWEHISSSWTVLDTRLRHRIGIILSVWILSILVLFSGTRGFWDLFANMLNDAYSNPSSTTALIFSTFAKNFSAVPVDVYIQKLFILFLRLRAIYSVLSTMVIIGMIARTFRPGFRLLAPPIVVAAIALGFITSMRIAGPLAGLIVVLYLLRNAGKKALVPILVYGLLSITAMYITWPYLWSDSVGRLVESLRVMSAFPWAQQVLFNGAQYSADTLPRTYLPVLFAIQLTEPVWMLFFAGLILAIINFIKTRQCGGVLFLLFGWFIIPLLVFSLGGFSFYDNFRQVLFILPPVFLMAGIAFSKIKQPYLQWIVIALVILPGIVDGIRLHPYEYIYYNRFVGGLTGAQGRFELDYWGTSYREAAEYVNSVAPPNSYIWVEGPAHLFGSFAREDLKVLDTFDPVLDGGSYLAVALMRQNLDQIISSPDTKTIYTVTSNNVPLTVIKQSESLENHDKQLP